MGRLIFFKRVTKFILDFTLYFRNYYMEMYYKRLV